MISFYIQTYLRGRGDVGTGFHSLLSHSFTSRSRIDEKSGSLCVCVCVCVYVWFNSNSFFFQRNSWQCVSVFIMVTIILIFDFPFYIAFSIQIL